MDDKGKIAKPPEVLECDSDERAVQLAKPLLDGHDIEIWHGNRVVTVLTRHENE